MFVETLTRYNRHSWPIEVKVKGSPVPRAGRRCCMCNHRSQEGPSALSTKRQARQDQVTTMCCENPACKKARLMQKKGGLHLLAFLWYVCFLISCMYARVLCILDCCFDCCYRMCQRRVSRISLHYGAQTGRFTCKSSPNQGAERA